MDFVHFDRAGNSIALVIASGEERERRQSAYAQHSWKRSRKRETHQSIQKLGDIMRRKR
jgi:hypothetical protein